MPRQGNKHQSAKGEQHEEGAFFSTGRNTEEKVIGKCKICGKETRTVIRHKKTKQIIGTGCISEFCKYRGNELFRKEMRNILRSRRIIEK